MTLPRPTDRMRYVLPAARHLPAYYGWSSSARRAARWGTLDDADAWRDFAVIAGHHALRGFGPFVAELHDGTVVGIFGAWHPEGQAEAEIKWTVWPDALEGRGFASEAARAVIDHSRESLGWTKAVSYIAPDNHRSAALATRLGAVSDGTWTTPSGKQVDVWRHPMGAAA